MASNDDLLEFLLRSGTIKETLRAGWVQRGVRDAESVGDHMWRMALLSMTVARDGGKGKTRAAREGYCWNDVEMDHSVDAESCSYEIEFDGGKCVRMALVHDIAEAVVGDITPADGISKEEKSKMEEAAMNSFLKDLGGEASAFGNEMMALWREYEENTTPNALLVHDIDKFEMLLQAYEYERRQGVPLQEFFDSVYKKKQIKTELVHGWCKALDKRRSEKSSAEFAIAHMSISRRTTTP